MNIQNFSKTFPSHHPVSFFGCCIRKHKDVTVIGARCGSPYDPVGPGYVDIYIDDKYTQTLKGNVLGERFGVSIALNEQYLCVGAYRENTGADNGGSVYVYRRYGALYELVCLLYAPDKAEKDYFGYNIAIENNLLVVGAYAKNVIGGEDGKAYVFNIDDQVCYLKLQSHDPQVNANYGRAVAIHKGLIYIGCHKHNKQGCIHVYDTWGRYVTELSVPNTKGFGNSIQVTDKYIIVGAYETNDNGSVCIYSKKTCEWKLISNHSKKTYFGGSLSVDKNKVAIGSYRYGPDEQGAVFLYDLDTEILEEIPNPTNQQDWYGYSVYVKDNLLYVGSVKDNCVYTYDLV